MVLENTHDFVFVEVGNPMEESIEISGRITVKCFTSRVDRDMIVDELYLVTIVLERLDHVVFLIPK